METAKKMTLFGLVWPIMIELFLQFMIGTADTLMVSRISDDAVAVVGISNQFFQAVIMLFVLISSGAGIVISQKLGAGKEEEARKVASMAFTLTVGLGLVVSLFLFFGANIFVNMLHVPESLHAMTYQYIRVVGSGTIVMSAILTLSTVIRSTGNTKGPMLVAVGMNIIHIFGNYVFIFGALGLPKWGLLGVSLSTVGSRAIALLVLFYIFRKSFTGLIQWRDLRLFDRPLLKEVAKVGLPMAFSSASWTISQVILFSMIATMGAEQLAARTYLNTMESFSFLAGWSFAMAVQIQVAHLFGAGQMEKAYRSLYKALFWGELVVITNTILLFIFGKNVVGAFTDNQEIISIVVGVMALNLLLQPLKMWNMPLNNALNAVGETKFVMNISIVCMWIIAVGGTYLFGLQLGWLIYGVYVAMILDEGIRGILVQRRWLARKKLPKKPAPVIQERRGIAGQM
ncbi:MATE family efflux transporter [Paenibacillus sp. HWE-109]|uniref:MATE family efflux transporter n=1 Tax=Paenibacillus sp. HWE-109 TaxID=1306526 RepID=UPI001EDE566D|nr:MATE family efflux transporter [Paenibacillus sp. HWE-109]UKS27843.1 MATE family efflux transporter [Paenibacillus sp. HWE-109]